MNKSIDWSEWILQKNSEYSRELEKNMPMLTPTAPPGEGGGDDWRKRPKKPKSSTDWDKHPVNSDHGDSVRPQTDEYGHPVTPRPVRPYKKEHGDAVFGTTKIKKSIDWSEWILQKNNEVKQEELKKSNFVILEKSTWEYAPHITSDKCICGGRTYKDQKHHYTCVDANHKPQYESDPNISMADSDGWSDQLKNAVKQFNKDVTHDHIKWSYDAGHAYSHIDHPSADSDKFHFKDEGDKHYFEDLTNQWLYDNEHTASRPDCIQGAECGCNP